jgi:hypothetical protein
MISFVFSSWIINEFHYLYFICEHYLYFIIFKAQLDEAKKATQVRPEMIRAETVTTTEAALDQAEPSGDTPGTNWG